MLKPERLPDLPQPSWLPEPEWIKPVKAKAQTVSAPSGGGAILGSIGNAIGSLSGIASPPVLQQAALRPLSLEEGLVVSNHPTSLQVV